MEKKLSSGAIVLMALAGFFVLLLLWVMSSYNALVGLDENAKTAQADIEVQYQRRFDLIPNLVATAQGIGQLEKDIFNDLAQARSRYSGATAGSPERLDAINQTESALARLLVIVENYPQLKSAESFRALQDQIEGTENRVSVARNNYNAVVNNLNKKLRSFPSTIVGTIFGFEPRDRFEITSDGAQNAPPVQFKFE